MNSKKIEVEAVGKLINLLNRNDRLDSSNITYNDKTHSWDGHIELYSAVESQNKSTMIGRIPVQVKGTYNSNLNASTISFPVEVAHLKNYRADGGVIFFVIRIADFDNCKVYYNALLPYDLKMLFNRYEKRPKKKTKKPTLTIELSPFLYSFDNANVPFVSFLRDREDQYSTVKFTPTTSDELNSMKKNFSGYHFMITTGTNLHLLDAMVSQPIYTYGISKDTGIKIPISKLNNATLEFNRIDASVTMGGKEYFNRHAYKHSSLKDTLVLGNGGIEIDLYGTGNFRYDIKGTLSNRISILQFLMDFRKYHSIEIDGNPIVEYDATSIEFPEHFAEDLIYLKRIQTMLNDLQVKEDLDLDSFNDEDYNNLYILYKGIFLEKKLSQKHTNVELEDGAILFTRFEIANMGFLILILGRPNGRFEMKKITDIMINEMNIELHYEDRTEPTSPFVLLQQKDFEKTVNLDYTFVVQHLVSIQYSDLYMSRLNPLLLNMIRAYDNTHKQELLAACIIVSKWIFDNENNTNSEINYIQCVKRDRTLNSNEIMRLYDLRTKESDTDKQLAIAILLGNLPDIDFYYNALEDEPRDNFDKFPISNLKGTVVNSKAYVDKVSKLEVAELKT